MMIVLIGGSGSGKSQTAEDTAVTIGNDKLVYIATMQPFDHESKERVKKHQRMRQDKNFKTIECFTGLDKVEMEKDTTVLLECMSNLVANEMFSPEGAGEEAFHAVKKGICRLTEQTDDQLIVTNNVFEDGIQYDVDTMKYIRILGQVNQWLCQEADKVVEVVHGIAVELKNNIST